MRLAFLNYCWRSILCLCLGRGRGARADDVQVSAALSDDTPRMRGNRWIMTITVNGATDASVPENINVDGLTITYVGAEYADADPALERDLGAARISSAA